MATPTEVASVGVSDLSLYHIDSYCLIQNHTATSTTSLPLRAPQVD